MSVLWNLWHGCKKISAGCQNCYVYRTDAKFERDASEVKKTTSFYLPRKKNRAGEYKIPSGETVYTCFTSDFFLDYADEWRREAWEMIRERPDLHFIMITKRPDRFYVSLPDDWGDGYENVTIGCTAENADRAAYRLPIFASLPIKHKIIICEPLLSEIDLSPYLFGIEEVVAGGESGNEARVCDFEWVKRIRRDCVTAGVDFTFKQTGARFRKDGRLYRIERKYQHSQAKRAGIDYHA